MPDPAGQLPALIDPRHTAMAVIDMQNCFCDESNPAYAAVMARLPGLIAAARRAGVLLIYTQVVQTEATDTEVWHSLYERAPWFRDLCRQGSHGADYHDHFRPQPGDVALVKHRYSAFVGTELKSTLRSRGIKTLVLTGLTSDCCVGTTAHDAFQFDFHSILVADCAAAATPALHEAALATHADAFGLVVSADDVEAVWSGSAGA